MKKRFLILSFILFQVTHLFAQYEGGNGDGNDVETELSTTLTNLSLSIIYEGSNGDGFSNRTLIATTLENISLAVLYEGSNGDGFAIRSLEATTLENISLTVLYEGSNGDGFASRTLESTTLENISLSVLYEGSNGDGFASRTLQATTLDNISLTVLYEGSNGDGFSSRTLQATTLDNISLTVLYEGGNGDGFSVDQENVFLDPNQIVDLRLNIKVLLQGATINPTNAGLMNDNLRFEGYIPTTSPYLDMKMVNASVFNLGGTSGVGNISNDIVDWVWIEIRSNIDNTLIIDDTSALVQRDGDVVDIDGVSNISLEGFVDNYFVAVKHRNHLSTMTSNSIPLSVNPTNVDFTSNATSTFGNNAQVQLLNGDMALWAGNVNGDTLVQYSGTTPDSPSILATVLNDPGNFLNFPTFIINGYNIHDVNLDGITQYTGITPEPPILLENVLDHPGNFLNFSTYQIQEQLPEN